MLTRNFYRFNRSMNMYADVAFVGKTGGSGTILASYLKNHTPLGKALGMSTIGTYGVQFGTGNTPASFDDYKLESALSSGITVTVPSAVTIKEADNYEEWIAAFVVTSTNAVTISEMGIFGEFYHNSSGYQYALFERTVLENPLVFAAGETKTINYTIRFNYPTT